MVCTTTIEFRVRSLRKSTRQPYSPASSGDISSMKRRASGFRLVSMKDRDARFSLCSTSPQNGRTSCRLAAGATDVRN
ncbi:hypothetical protein TYRP_000166 [Tyrophagus putrescentiae]|nr:hypothetical protein TYRP_000166 [Tyrophagus putrescentiae]